MSSKWEEIREDFRRVVFRRGVGEVAEEIPVHRDTVYTWVRGEHRPRRLAVRRIEEILRDEGE